MARPKVANEANVKLWTIKEVAALLCVSDRTVQRMITAGEVEAVNVRGARRVRAQSVLAYVEGARQGATAGD